MRGRPPVPTALREIRGNTGHRPANAEEPDIPVARPSIQPPAHLTDTARAKWFELIDTLTASRLLTVADIGIFSSYCLYYAEHAEYAERVASEGPYVIIQKKDKDGKPIQGVVYTEWNPARIMRDSAWEKMRKAANDLGLTPSARSRVKKDGSKEEGKTANELRAILRA